MLEQKRNEVPLFRPGKNCWRTSRLSHGALLVDCANFYRALHSAIVKARKSIFIVGWDIDSRIRLLRGEDEKNSPYPSYAGDLLTWKAEQNPEMQIYLLRWDSSLSFMAKRELWAKRVWELRTPPNVHVWLDQTIPAGGSHHQKIIIIDDEIVFTGGMDIARERWDERDHKLLEPDRFDIDTVYEPYHDIQIVLSGPVVKDLADLARWRWHHAAGYEVQLPYDPVLTDKSGLPRAWPEGFVPQLFDMDCAIVRTMPWMGQEPASFEVRQMYLDLIACAEDFIYIENQFFSYLDIAEALNQRLKQRPQLKAFLVSSFNPQGFFEREGLWAPRIDFKRILMDGISPAQVRMAYPYIRDQQGDNHYKRIHSKILIVDDRYCNVASSNISNRSMSLDTECDLVLAAAPGEQRDAVVAIRNDLIAEHTGRKIDEVAAIFGRGAVLDEFLDPESMGERGLKEIDDSGFTKQTLQPIMRRLADPSQRLLPVVYTLNPLEIRPMHNPHKRVLIWAALLLFALAFGFTVLVNYGEWLEPERIAAFLELSRGTVWALPLVCLIYLVGGLIIFPVTVLSLVTAAVFGPLWGPLYAMCGALLSAALLFWIGHIAGIKGVRKLIGEKARKVESKMEKQGVTGIVAVRLVPLAPYSIVNLVAGISSLRFIDYIIGTFLGLLPGLLAKGFLGDSLMQLFINPAPQTLAYVAGGIIFWLILVIGAQKFVRKMVASGAANKKDRNVHPHSQL